MEAPILSVLIVNWNTRQLLRECLKSLRTVSEQPLWEIIVVDNGSVDGSGEMVRQEFPQVRLIVNSENRGYAAANNQAAQTAQGCYFLLLNSDTRVLPNSVERLLAFAQSHPKAGAVAPKLVYPDGRIQLSLRSFPTPLALLFAALGLDRIFPHSRWIGRYRMTWFTYDRVAEVDQPMASALLVRREAWEQAGGMDEAMPVFFNDVDFCWRLKKAGWRIYFLPDAVVIHHHGASTRLLGIGKALESHRGLLRFYDKHFRPLLPFPLYALLKSSLAFGSALRLLAAFVANAAHQTTVKPIKPNKAR